MEFILSDVWVKFKDESIILTNNEFKQVERAGRELTGEGNDHFLYLFGKTSPALTPEEQHQVDVNARLFIRANRVQGKEDKISAIAVIPSQPLSYLTEIED